MVITVFHRECVLVMSLRDRRTSRFHRNESEVAIVSCVSRYEKVGFLDRTVCVSVCVCGDGDRRCDVVVVCVFMKGRGRRGVTRRAGGGRRASLTHPPMGVPLSV
jgi:hypothetical protein